MAGILDSVMDKLDMLYSQRYFEKKSRGFGVFLGGISLSSMYVTLFYLFLVFLLFVFLVFFSPLLIRSENRTALGVGAIVYNIVSVFMMCHQLPMRSLFISGVQQAVCARDIGIYSGISLGGLLFIFRVPEFFKTKKFFLLSLIPIMLDGITQTVMNLRESSNILRVVTGFIFGFGLMFFVLTRIRKLNAPEFRKTITRKIFILALAVLLLTSLLILISAGSLFGSFYVSKNDAIKLALNSTSESALVFYVPPRTPFSFYFYPYKESYEDYILSDIGGMKWVESQIKIIFNDSAIPSETDLFDVLPLTHYYGIWVVVQPSETAESVMTTSSVVFCHKKGTYYYVDALTGEVFDSRSH